MASLGRDVYALISMLGRGNPGGCPTRLGRSAVAAPIPLRLLYTEQKPEVHFPRTRRKANRATVYRALIISV
jgi:hypothetical protein